MEKKDFETAAKFEVIPDEWELINKLYKENPWPDIAGWVSVHLRKKPFHDYFNERGDRILQLQKRLKEVEEQRIFHKQEFTRLALEKERADKEIAHLEKVIALQEKQITDKQILLGELSRTITHFSSAFTKLQGHASSSIHKVMQEMNNNPDFIKKYLGLGL